MVKVAVCSRGSRRSAEGSENETVDTVDDERGGKWGGGILLPIRLGVLGQRRVLLQQSRGVVPAENGFGAFLGHPERKFQVGLCFTADVLFVLPRDLRVPWADRRETLPRYRKVLPHDKLGPKIWGPFAPQKKLGAKVVQNLGRFRTTSKFDREYLRNG